MWHFTADTFDFFLAVFAQKIEAYAVPLSFLDGIIKTVTEDKILRARQITLEYTVLHPLAKALQNAMDAATTFVVFHII
jgi:hypothetical protein